MNTRSAPNRPTLPQKVSVDTGIRSSIKTLPQELLTRKEQKAVLPFLSAPRILSKAEKFATDFYKRTKELEEIDAYHERVRTDLKLPETEVPLKPKEVKVVNVDEIVKKVNDGISLNPGVAPVAMPPPLPPSSGRRSSSTQTDNMVQINPLTREISTTSTQTMREMADASTSARPTIATGSTQTDVEPMTGGDLARMSLDPPLQQIVNNYTYQNQHTINNFLQQHHNDVTHNQFIHNTVMQDIQNTQNVLHMNNLQQVLNANLDHRPTAHNPIQQNVIEGPMEVPAVTYRERLMIEAPPTEAIRLPVPNAERGDGLPAYGDVDMDFGPANPPEYQPMRQRRIIPIVMPQAPPPPPYQRLQNPNRFRPRITGRLTPAQTAARIIERRNLVSLPQIPAGHAYDTRPAVPENRIRDEGWFAQGIDDAPKPPTKRKGARLVKDTTPKRIRIGY